MNKTGISWCDFTFNPLVGCTNNCSFEGEPYCYARDTAEKRGRCQKCINFTPHAHWERLDRYPKKDAGRAIFLGSMAGIWEPGAFPDADIQRVLDFVASRPGDTFLTLTKNPGRHRNFYTPEHLWCGATVTDNRDADRAFDGILPTSRLWFGNTWISATHNRFISFEPLLEDVSENKAFQWAMEEEWFRCIIIGPLNHRGKTPTKAEWILNLMEVAEDAGVMVHLKPQCKLAGISDELIQAHQQTPWTSDTVRKKEAGNEL